MHYVYYAASFEIMETDFTDPSCITSPESQCGVKPCVFCPCEKEATGEVSPMEASLLRIGGWLAIEPWNLSVGLCGLAAGALCPDLADLKSAGSQLPEHWLRCPGSPLRARSLIHSQAYQSPDKRSSWLSTDHRQGVRKQT